MYRVRGRLSLLVLLLLALALPVCSWAAKPVPVCGDGKCSGGETAASCPQDCAAPPAVCNNNGICNAGETCLSCPGDCAGVTGGKPATRYCCGANGYCDAARCGADCGSPLTPYCGDGIVGIGEECDDGNTASGDGCSADCRIEYPALVPVNQFNIGDSIGEGEAANGTIGETHHETVWSTGYNAGDTVTSLNERFEGANPGDYLENSAAWDPVFNHALSGAVMADFAAQANAIVEASFSTPTDSAGMIALLLGNNDVCAPSLAEMTDPAVFEAQYRAGLDILAASPATREARIHVSSIPAIYWLWEAKRTNLACRLFIWPFVPCENLLASPGDDCASDASRQNPDVIYAGDGVNCVRRKTFHARIRDTYNPILRSVLQEYVDNGGLPNAYYVDIFGVRFLSTHVNDGDCFHPSTAGHALLAEEGWLGSPWSK